MINKNKEEFLKRCPKYAVKGIIVMNYKDLDWVRYPYEEKEGKVEEIKGDFYYGKLTQKKLSSICLACFKDPAFPGKMGYELCLYDENGALFSSSIGVINEPFKSIFEIIDKNDILTVEEFNSLPDSLSLLTKKK
jgi:hypothetical protein